MNFSLPKLSAVALLSLAAGFGASMWLNATESEGPGTPPVLVIKCITTFDYDPDELTEWKKHMQLDVHKQVEDGTFTGNVENAIPRNGPATLIHVLCTPCLAPSPCLQQVDKDVTYRTAGRDVEKKFKGKASLPAPCGSCTTDKYVYYK